MNHFTFLFCLVVSFVVFACAPKEKSVTDQPPRVGSSQEPTADAEASSSQASNLQCEAAGDIRRIEIRETNAGGCEVVYTRDGNPRVVADAKNELSYCDRVAQKIRGNLEDAEFRCNPL